MRPARRVPTQRGRALVWIAAGLVTGFLLGRTGPCKRTDSVQQPTAAVLPGRKASLASTTWTTPPSAGTGGAATTTTATTSVALTSTDPALPAISHAAVTTLSWAPRAFLWRAALSAADADALVAAAGPRLTPSTLALRPGERAEEKAGIRTSDGTFLSSADDATGVLARALAVAAALTGLPLSHGEAFNILRYRPGARYEAHYDAFSPGDGYGPQASSRLATVLFYLSDVEEGGETVFPLAGEAGAARLAAGEPVDYKACDGLRVRPAKGDALAFWSAHPNGTADLQALHGGCPVVRGEKWVATLWLRDQADAVM